jgi:hypothetical protein
MSEQQHLDEHGTIELTRVRETLDRALVVYGGDLVLRRAFIQGIGAIDDRLGRPREWPNRRIRRQGR